MSGGEPDCEDWEGRVKDLSKEIVGEGKGAQSIEHLKGVTPACTGLFFPRDTNRSI